MAMLRKKVLIVEDESLIARDIQNSLQKLVYNAPAVAFTGEEAVKMTEEMLPDFIFMDIILGGSMDGIDAAGEIRKRFDIPFAYLTAYTDESTLERAKVTEPYGYILKPFKVQELHATIETSLYRHEKQREFHA